MKTIYGAVISALISSLCCLPALLYLVFGVGVFGSLASLDWLRIPAGIISLIFLFASFFFTCKSCEVGQKRKRIVVWCVVFILTICILFYPEIIYFFTKD
ncbi:MAG: hypothetical protein ACK5LP_03245 [Campylobacteraceae bacterium]